MLTSYTTTPKRKLWIGSFSILYTFHPPEEKKNVIENVLPPYSNMSGCNISLFPSFISFRYLINVFDR